MRNKYNIKTNTYKGHLSYMAKYRANHRKQLRAYARNYYHKMKRDSKK